MKLYWCANTRAFRIAWLLEEAGVPYQRVTIDIRDAAAKNEPAFRAVSPLGKVPALEDGPARLNDSGAIAIYVADAYPAARLAPAVGDPARAAFLQWVVYPNSVIEPAMIEKFMKLTLDPRSIGWGSWDSMLQTLRGALAPGPWLLGERFTAADVLVGAGVRFLREFKMIENEPALEAYVDRCAARPAFQRALAFDKG